MVNNMLQTQMPPSVPINRASRPTNSGRIDSLDLIWFNPGRLTDNSRHTGKGLVCMQIILLFMQCLLFFLIVSFKFMYLSGCVMS